MLLFFLAILLVLAAAAEVFGRSRGPPLLLLVRRSGVTVAAVAAVVASVAVLGRGGAALPGRGRGVRGGLVGGGPAAALSVGGVGVAAGAGAGEADAGEDAGLGLGRRRLRLGGLRLVPRRGRRRRGRRQREVVVAVGGGALLARAGGAVRGAPRRVPEVGAGRRRRRRALRPVWLGMRPSPLQGKQTKRKQGTGPQVSRLALPEFAIVRPRTFAAPSFATAALRPTTRDYSTAAYLSSAEAAWHLSIAPCLFVSCSNEKKRGHIAVQGLLAYLP